MESKSTENRLEMTLPSRLGVVGDAIRQVRDFLGSGSEGDDSGLILVFRELVNNAIEHGNKKVEELEVDVILERLEESRYCLEVTDQGDGFDHSDLDVRLPDDPTQVRNRGLALVNSFVDEFRFNEVGNQVTAWMTLPGQSAFEVTQDDTWKTIQPTGDITAEVAEDFRNLLLNMVRNGYQKYRFDLTNVSEVDSIGLSLFVVFANMLQKRAPNAELHIVGANKDVANLFLMTRLNRIYQLD